MDIRIKAFKDLALDELYALLKLREEVFILEQNILYPDLDGTDQLASHIMIFENSILVAYARAYERGIKYQDASIGRVVTSPSVRGQGYGIPLMKTAMAHLMRLGESSITISSQAYAKEFYLKFGFTPTEKEPYLEDGIPHLEMKFMTEGLNR